MIASTMGAMITSHSIEIKKETAAVRAEERKEQYWE